MVGMEIGYGENYSIDLIVLTTCVYFLWTGLARHLFNDFYF